MSHQTRVNKPTQLCITLYNHYMRLPLFITVLITPSLLLLLFWLLPDWDARLQLPLFHFYVVTFTTFAAAVVSILLAMILQPVAQTRHALSAVAFAVMGAIFFTHGLPTPGALVDHFHPAVQWSAWLTLFGGGLIFCLASYDTPDRYYKWLSLSKIGYVAATSVAGYLAVTLFAPHWLQWIEQQSAPWYYLLTFYLTLALWLWAGLRLWRIWQRTGNRVDGMLTLVSFWLAQATISLHQFPLWQLGWWLYHFLLLAAFLATLFILVAQYEQARQFRLLPYYLATSLIITVLLALVSAYLYADFTAGFLNQGNVFQRRITGLIIAASSMGILFLVLLLIVRRADRVISQNTAELALAYDNLRRSEQIRQDLTNMIVHDLRTPLTSITVSLDLAARNKDAGLNLETDVVDRAQRAAARLDQMVDDILTVSKLEAGELEIKLQPVAVQAFLAERLEGFSTQAAREAKALQLACEPDLIARLDPSLLGRVIENLIANGLKYTRANGFVHVSAWCNDQKIWMAVQDNGVGIPEAYRERIFGKFVQVPSDDNQTVRRGTGLGLAFCRLVVEAHNGRIWVENNEEGGSAFRFWLPM
jgi:signal transduction histidine kinase